MFGINTEATDRGQVGIGTLIVFIAMVLVAAIAAGVLINTAGLLQSQAESTGQESTDQVSNSLTVSSITGEVVASDSSGDVIPAVAIDVSLGPGSNPIDLTDATISWTGEQDSATFVIAEQDFGEFESDDGQFINDDESEDGSVTVDSNAIVDDGGEASLTDSGDSATIFIVADSISFDLDRDSAWEIEVDSDSLGSDMPLTEGDSAELTITTADGGQTYPTIVAPDLLEDGEGVRL